MNRSKSHLLLHCPISLRFFLKPLGSISALSLRTTAQSAYPDEFSGQHGQFDSRYRAGTTSTRSRKTLRENVKLLDLHAALLNHSTAMNRYDVGIRDFQANIKWAWHILPLERPRSPAQCRSYKLQFYVDPEERTYPTYRNPPALAPLPRAETHSSMIIVSPPSGSTSNPSDARTELPTGEP